MNKPRVIIAPTRPNGRRYWVIMAFLPALIAIFATQFLLLPADLHVEEVLLEKNRLMLVLSSTQLTAACPHCSSLSAHVHSHYTRTLVDLPCQERAVVLRVQVRRFFCPAAACAHRTFAEQFPALAPAYARRTSRQLQRLCQIALALGGRPAARLLSQQAMPTSFSTVLRLLRHSSASLLLLRQYVRGTGLAGLGLGSTELVQEGRQASAERRIPCLQFSDQTSGRHSQSPA